ncbi:MAG: universal stress protein [Rhodobacteraceae bacterium]|nr:universal stress protein [Paracoccaceae bacterium]
MTYKSILVYLRTEAQAKSLLAATALLADKHEAHVIGMYVASSFEALPAMGIQVPDTVLEAQEKLHEAEAKAIKGIFDKYAISQLTNWEWRQPSPGGSTISKTVVNHASCVDLVVLAQPAQDTNFLEPDLVFEMVLMASGRPVLVIPEGFQSKTVGTQIAVAWNGTRESARAAFDAIPLMRAVKGNPVALIWLETPIGQSGDRIPGSELAASLAHHNIEVEVTAVPKTGPTGAQLLELAKQHGADLLVMGAYGHSRIGEFVFGGATDHVLRHMKIPVLMSH